MRRLRFLSRRSSKVLRLSPLSTISPHLSSYDFAFLGGHQLIVSAAFRAELQLGFYIVIIRQIEHLRHVVQVDVRHHFELAVRGIPRHERLRADADRAVRAAVDFDRQTALLRTLFRGLRQAVVNTLHPEAAFAVVNGELLLRAVRPGDGFVFHVILLVFPVLQSVRVPPKRPRSIFLRL